MGIMDFLKVESNFNHLICLLNAEGDKKCEYNSINWLKEL